MKRALAGALSLLLAAACGHPSTVSRVYGGRVVDGAFVGPEAYGAYLAGVLAEEAGDLPAAARAYATAIDEDGDDPEPYVRLAAVRCRLGQSAVSSFAEARRIDRGYAPALAAEAECLAKGGHGAEGLAALDAIAAADRGTPELEALYVRLAAPTNVDARARAISLTAASADVPAAWTALVAFGRGKGEPELVAHGLAGLVRAAPLRSAEVERGARELLGQGHTALAQRVAASITDASELLAVRGPRDPVVARLAVDEALARGDLAAVQRRAARGHVELGEAAARAALLGRPGDAKLLAAEVRAADPRAACATLTALGLASGRPTAALPAPVPDACALVVVDRLAATGNVEAAAAFARGVGLVVAAEDPVTGPVAVGLAARGALAPSSLPVALRIELAARRRELPPALDASVDAKHALLWHALVEPGSAATRARLASFRGAERDPIVGFALAKIALAGLPASDTAGWELVRAAIAASPGDPLLLAAAVELAKQGGRPDEVRPARARLSAYAATPAERALATE